MTFRQRPQHLGSWFNFLLPHVTWNKSHGIDDFISVSTVSGVIPQCEWLLGHKLMDFYFGLRLFATLCSHFFHILFSRNTSISPWWLPMHLSGTKNAYQQIVKAKYKYPWEPEDSACRNTCVAQRWAVFIFWFKHGLRRLDCQARIPRTMLICPLSPNVCIMYTIIVGWLQRIWEIGVRGYKVWKYRQKGRGMLLGRSGVLDVMGLSVAESGIWKIW